MGAADAWLTPVDGAVHLVYVRLCDVLHIYVGISPGHQQHGSGGWCFNCSCAWVPFFFSLENVSIDRVDHGLFLAARTATGNVVR